MCAGGQGACRYLVSTFLTARRYPTTTRPEFSLIALICAGYEKTIAKDSWRSPHQSHRDYLNQLVTWGYTASETETFHLQSAEKRQP